MIKLIVNFVTIIGLSCFSLMAQNYELKIEVRDYPGEKVYLALIQGDDVVPMDSAVVSGDHFVFSLEENSVPGMYRVVFPLTQNNQGRRDPLLLDIIFNQEDIELITSYPQVSNEVEVINSEENKKYFRFLKLESDYRKHLALLFPLAELYDTSDSFFEALHQELIYIQKDYNNSLVKLANTDPDMLVSSIISLHMEPVYDPLINGDPITFMKDNYLRPVSFNDGRLINTKYLSQKIISYLSFYRQDNSSSKREQEESFIEAVDKIMQEVSYNEKIYDFVLNYLIDGFEKFQMEEVLVHIAENHLDGECKTESEEIVKERLEAYKRMAHGNKVPDINLLDPFDIPYRLSSIEEQMILLVFWSTECPHCTNLMPRLDKWYTNENNDKRLEIYTVSIDKSRADWEEYILMTEPGGIHVYDPEGWESKTSQRYNLYATPTMFLLDEELRILDKPVTFRDFKSAFEKFR